MRAEFCSAYELYADIGTYTDDGTIPLYDPMRIKSISVPHQRKPFENKTVREQN